MFRAKKAAILDSKMSAFRARARSGRLSDNWSTFCRIVAIFFLIVGIAPERTPIVIWSVREIIQAVAAILKTCVSAKNFFSSDFHFFKFVMGQNFEPNPTVALKL